MLHIKVEGIDRLLTSMNALMRQEVPFAVAKALTDTAVNVRNEVLSGLPGRFTLRTGWAQPNTPYGFKVEKATKTNWTARVFTRAPWMVLQEHGGIKAVGGKRLAIPFVYHSGTKPGVVFGAKRTKRDLISKKDLPRNLGNGVFHIKTNSGNELLAQRTGKGKRSVLRILYALEQSGRIKRRLMLAETASRVVAEKWPGNVQAALDYAVKTSRLG